MGWGTEEEPGRRASLEDEVLATLAGAKERRVKKWDPLAKKEEAKQVDPSKAKAAAERFLKVQAAKVAAAKAAAANEDHPSLSELRRRKEEKAERERAEKERAEQERAENGTEEVEQAAEEDITDATPSVTPRTLSIASSVTAQRLERSRARSGGPDSSRGAGSSHDSAASPRQAAAPAYVFPLPWRNLAGLELTELLVERDNLLAAASLQPAWAEVEALLAPLLDRQRTELGDRHKDTVTSMEMYGLLLTTLCRYEEALPVTLEAADARREVFGDAHAKTKAADENLAHLQGSLDMAQNTDFIKQAKQQLAEVEKKIKALNGKDAAYQERMRENLAHGLMNHDPDAIARDAAGKARDTLARALQDAIEAKRETEDRERCSGKTDAVASAKLTKAANDAKFAREASEFFREWQKKNKTEEELAEIAKAEAEAAEAEDEASREEREEAEAARIKAEALELALNLVGGARPKQLGRRVYGAG